MGFDGWLQIFEELTYRRSRHLWGQEEQQMEGAGGRFHMNTRQNFLTLREWRGEWLSHGWCPGAVGQFLAQDTPGRIQRQKRAGLR